MTDRQRTVRDLTPALGATVQVRFESLTVTCTVVDATNAWGKVRLMVQPVAGEGRQWVELGRLVAVEPTTPAECHEAHEAARERAQGARFLHQELR